MTYAKSEEDAVRVFEMRKKQRKWKRQDAAEVRAKAKAKAKITLPKFSWDK